MMEDESNTAFVRCENCGQRTTCMRYQLTLYGQQVSGMWLCEGCAAQRVPDAFRGMRRPRQDHDHEEAE